GYLTLRAVDNAGNLGPIGSSISFEMSKPKELFVNDGESYDGINSKELFLSTVPFLQEEVPGRGKVWSDTPPGMRDYREYNYMEFTQSVEVQHPDVVLQFDTKLDCTVIWERAEVEIRINEETDPFSEYSVWNPERGAQDWFHSPKWRMLAVYSAPKCEWSKVTIPLRNKLKTGDKIRLRFWFKAGGPVTDGHDGWLIDDIKLLGPGSPEKPTGFTATRATETSPYVLNWTDNSNGETRFEIKSGTFSASTATNVTQYETGRTVVESDLRIRACNGVICSDWSDPVLVMAPPPRLTSIFPTAGPLAGGNTLTVNGAGFLPGAVIRIQGVDCPRSIRVSENQMTCILPPKEAGAYHVAVLNRDAQKAVLRFAYTYQAAPSVSSISPAIGQISEGETLTIKGTGFLAGASVVIGTKSCTNVLVDMSTQIRCTVLANSEGSYQVLVRNSDGQVSSVGPSAQYRVISPRWVATQGAACTSVCASVGLASRPSPEGSYCTSGESIPVSAFGKLLYRNGCWPNRDCRAQGYRSTIQVGQYCYGASQRRDKGKTDVTMGCYCGL
ncbi:MAG: IPT/TIG domain-containing protein, partial [Pseudomonadota bacterium]